MCSPDYKDTGVDEAVADFRARIKNYELAYEPLDHTNDKSVLYTNTDTVHVHS